MKTKYFNIDIDFQNNISETSITVALLSLSVVLQHVKSISYFGIVLGTSNSRILLFMYDLPPETGLSRKFHTKEVLIDSGSDGIVTTKYHQWGRKRLLGFEHVHVARKVKA